MLATFPVVPTPRVLWVLDVAAPLFGPDDTAPLRLPLPQLRAHLLRVRWPTPRGWVLPVVGHGDLIPPRFRVLLRLMVLPLGPRLLDAPPLPKWLRSNAKSRALGVVRPPALAVWSVAPGVGHVDPLLVALHLEVPLLS